MRRAGAGKGATSSHTAAVQRTPARTPTTRPNIHDETPLPDRPVAPATVAMFPDSAHSLYWPRDVARYNMEALVFLSSGWLKTACVLLALFWCVRRPELACAFS